MSGFVRANFSIAALALFACHSPPDVSRKPSKACRDAEQTFDRAIALREFERARSLRAKTYAACGPRAELGVQDRRIVDGEEKRGLAEADRVRRERDLRAALHAFFDFVSQTRARPELASLRPVCDEPPRAASFDGGPTARDSASPARFCVAKRSLGGVYPIEVRYDSDDSQCFRFTLGVDGPVDCADLGGSRERSWLVPVPGGGSITRSSCALTGPLAGLTAVVSSSTPSSVHVVSQRYVERDPAARLAFAPP